MSSKAKLEEMMSEVEAEMELLKDQMNNSSTDYFYDDRNDLKELENLEKEYNKLEEDLRNL